MDAFTSHGKKQQQSLLKYLWTLRSNNNNNNYTNNNTLDNDDEGKGLHLTAGNLTLAQLKLTWNLDYRLDNTIQQTKFSHEITTLV